MNEDLIETDGRRLRAQRSRAQIVEAMLALVGEGEMHPSAAQVAERAGVGLRTVFRHFEDMDSLYREMTTRLQEEILPLIQAPFAARDWRGRLVEVCARRATVYERILPFRVAGAIRRFQSEYLMRDYARTIGMEQSLLRSFLPKSMDPALAAALDAALSFETWRTLRQDQGLSRRKAEEVVRLMVDRLLA